MDTERIYAGKFFATRSPGPCQQFLRLKETEIQLLFSGPLIIPMHGYVISNDPTNKSVPEQLYCCNFVTLPIYCVFIWEVSHFVSFYFYDRMANNAEFVEYKTSTGKFPTYNQDFALLRTAVYNQSSELKLEICRGNQASLGNVRFFSGIPRHSPGSNECIFMRKNFF